MINLVKDVQIVALKVLINDIIFSTSCLTTFKSYKNNPHESVFGPTYLH